MPLTQIALGMTPELQSGVSSQTHQPMKSLLVQGTLEEVWQTDNHKRRSEGRHMIQQFVAVGSDAPGPHQVQCKEWSNQDTTKRGLGLKVGF